MGYRRRSVILVGLTGSIGSGKSTVSGLLAARGATVVDADAIVRELQAPGQHVFEAIVARFGPIVVAADGVLDRQALADIVFADTDALSDLNAIVHPAVGVEIARRLGDASGTDRVVLLDVPLLVESGRAGAAPSYGGTPLAALVVVDVDPEVAVARLVEQRGMAEADARARLARQASREERLARADFVLDNSGDRAALEAQVGALWPRLLALPQS